MTPHAPNPVNDPDDLDDDPSEDDAKPLDLNDEYDNEQTVHLVARAQGGEAEALNELFSRYHEKLTEVARRKLGAKLRTKEDPVDLAQTTFREATRDFQSYDYRGKGSVLRWLVQILQNKIRDKAEFYSAGKRDSSLETNFEAPSSADGESRGIIEPPADDLSVTRVVQRDENTRILHEALTQLPLEYRKAIVMVFYEGLTLRQAGEKLGGRSEDALRMMLRRAEAKLKDILKRKYGTDLG